MPFPVFRKTGLVVVTFISVTILSDREGIARSGNESGQRSSPLELAKKAQKIFSKELYDSVRDGIDDVVAEMPVPKKDGKESWKTLYIAEYFYNRIGIGEIVGQPKLIWNGIDQKNEKSIFILSDSEFSYKTAEGRIIKPGRMITDGGSTPKILHFMKSFSPWTYGPAYLVHDWIFHAHRCQIRPDDDFTMQQAAQVMFEVMKTMMEQGFTDAQGNIVEFKKNEDAAFLMYLAVSSGLAKTAWEREGCKISP